MPRQVPSPTMAAAMLAAAAALALPASARAAVTIGSDLTRAPTLSVACEFDSSCRFFQTSLPAGGNGFAAPVSGVVVRWRVKTAAGTPAGVPLRLRILHPEGDGTYTATAFRSTVVTSAAGGVQTTPTGGVIQAGDVIALDFTLVGAIAGAEVPGALGGTFEPILSGADTPGAFNDVELLFNGDIEPDADGDGAGDETQDGCPQDATLRLPCPADLAVANTADATSVSPGQTVTNTIELRNLGPYPASDVALHWSLFGLVAGVSAIDVGACPGLPPAPFTYTCTMATLPPGGVVVLSARVTPTAPSVSPMTSTVSAGEMGVHWQDPSPANNQAQAQWSVTGAVSAPDRTPPTLTVSLPGDRLATALRRGVRVNAGSSEACRGTVELRLARRLAARLRLPAKIGSMPFNLPTSGRAALRVRFTRAARRKLHRLRSVRLTARVAGADVSGNIARPVSASRTLRRRG